MGIGFNAARAQFLAQAIAEQKHRVQATTCYYCGKRVSTEEAVVRDDIVMCQKCAEEHPLTADTKKDKIN